jgi:hypothetical protein
MSITGVFSPDFDVSCQSYLLYIKQVTNYFYLKFPGNAGNFSIITLHLHVFPAFCTNFDKNENLTKVIDCMFGIRFDIKFFLFFQIFVPPLHVERPACCRQGDGGEV